MQKKDNMLHSTISIKIINVLYLELLYRTHEIQVKYGLGLCAACACVAPASV